MKNAHIFLAETTKLGNSNSVWIQLSLHDGPEKGSMLFFKPQIIKT